MSTRRFSLPAIERVEKLIEAHKNTFLALGGTPREVLYHNVEQVPPCPTGRPLTNSKRQPPALFASWTTT